MRLVKGTYDDAYDYAVKLVEETGATFVHPFNDPEVMAGQGAIGLEILEQLDDGIQCDRDRDRLGVAGYRTYLLGGEVLVQHGAELLLLGLLLLLFARKKALVNGFGSLCLRKLLRELRQIYRPVCIHNFFPPALPGKQADIPKKTAL